MKKWFTALFIISADVFRRGMNRVMGRENCSRTSITVSMALVCRQTRKNIFRDVRRHGGDCKSRIRQLISDSIFEQKLGIDTGGVETILDDSQCKDASCYEPERYRDLAKIFDHLHMTQSDVLVDLGCGKGRVVLFAGLKTPARAVGVELVPRLAQIALENVRKLKLESKITIVTSDVARYHVEQGTVFFVFNPFGPDTMKLVLENIHRSIISNPRPVRIVYSNYVPAQKLLDESPWLVSEGPIPGTRAWMWRNLPGKERGA